MKVFCMNCKYLETNFVQLTNLYDCKYPDNLTYVKLPDKWLAPQKEGVTYNRKPEEINMLNLCTWFEEEMKR